MLPSKGKKKTLSRCEPRQRTTTIDFDCHGFPEELKCPICLQIPEKEVYQCQNGHTICSRCFYNVQNCPQCRGSLTMEGAPIRNRAVESLLESMLIPCPYKGCKETFRRKNLPAHQINCNFNGKCMKICEKVGFRCQFLANALNPQAAANHFVGVHAAVPIKGGGVHIVFDEILKNISYFNEQCSTRRTEDMDGLWKPVVVTLSSGINLLILSFLMDEGKSIAFTFFHLGDSAGGPILPIQLSVESRCVNTPTLMWTVPAVPILQSEQFIQCPPFRIPVKLIEQNYIHCDALTLSCRFEEPPEFLSTNSGEVPETAMLGKIEPKRQLPLYALLGF